jgi:hypothetical protein
MKIIAKRECPVCKNMVRPQSYLESIIGLSFRCSSCGVQLVLSGNKWSLISSVSIAAFIAVVKRMVLPELKVLDKYFLIEILVFCLGILSGLYFSKLKEYKTGVKLD